MIPFESLDLSSSIWLKESFRVYLDGVHGIYMPSFSMKKREKMEKREEQRRNFIEK